MSIELDEIIPPATPFVLSEAFVTPVCGYLGIIDWTGIPCGVLAAVVPVIGQVFCLDAFDGKLFNVKAFDGKSRDMNGFDGKAFDLKATSENCNDA